MYIYKNITNENVRQYFHTPLKQLYHNQIMNFFCL